MKPLSSFASSFFLVASFAFFSFSVNSQSDSCSSNLNINSLLFDTTSLHCLQVWDAQSFVLRYGQSASSERVWSFVLSVPKPNSFVAMGFSKSGQMVGSSAVVGWVSADGLPTMKQYYLGAQSSDRVEPNQGNLTVLSDTSAVVSQSSRIYMAFQLEIPAGATQPETRLLYSVGPDGFLPVAPGFRLVEHRDKVATSINYVAGKSATKSSPHVGLRRSHGTLNMMGWGILTIVGAMVARYCRERDPAWFYAHAGIQSLALLLGVTGVLCGFLLDNRLDVNVSTHKGIGVFIFVLGILQAMALLARPHKSSKHRKYWNWYHYIVGRTLVVFAIANVFYGIHLGGEGSGWTAAYAVILCILVITSCFLEYRLWNRN